MQTFLTATLTLAALLGGGIGIDTATAAAGTGTGTGTRTDDGDVTDRTPATAFAARRETMRDWHVSFAAAVRPVLSARERLYRRLPHRLFARVRPYCEAVALAVEEAAAAYRPAPEPHVEVLARDLLLVYRDSARFCADGSYFSFTVRERQVRQLVGQLIAAFQPFGLTFPRASGTSAEEGVTTRSPGSAGSSSESTGAVSLPRPDS